MTYSLFTKFRLSNHSLMIEKGRYTNIELGDRSCPFCPDQVENEIHFLVQCPLYTKLREKMLEDIATNVQGFYYPNDDHFLFWFLLRNPLIADITGNFIRLAMELRAFLLQNPRNHTQNSRQILIELITPSLLLMCLVPCIVLF